jgi:hypothetical protein
LQQKFLPDPNSTILLMGYQAVGTLGRRIQEKPSYVEINGQNIPVEARIENITGYSSHKDSDGIVDMVSNTANTVKKVFVVMGEPKSALFLAQRLRDEAVGSPDDVFSLNVPSMMPLGKMVMTAPAALGSVSVADIRQRGGGLPPDFQFNAVNTSSSGLDLLRSYYDLGTWNGAAVQEGGVVEVQINSSLLDRFTHDQIVEMVKLVTLPGIDAEIVYKDDV